MKKQEDLALDVSKAFMKQILSSDVNNLLLIHLSLDNQGEWIWEYFKFIGELFRT